MAPASANAKAQGAVRFIDGRSEYDWNDDLARAIHACAPEADERRFSA